MKVNVNGIETHYEIHGREGAPWLTFSHSLACNLRMWDGQVAAFQDRYRILAYDTRGHGGSAGPAGAYSLEGLADDLRSLLRQLGISRTHFVGLSMGGMIGQTFALRHPGVFETMTLANTTSYYPPDAQAAWRDRIGIVEAKGLQPLVEPTLGRWFTSEFREQHPEKVQPVAAQILGTSPKGYIGCCHAIPKINLTARLKEIRTPTLVIGGEDDPATPPAMARAIHENLPGAKLAMIPRAAHLSNIEQPEAFNRALADFLSSPASATA